MQDLTLLKFVIFFLENPYDELYLRELAKKLKLSPFAIKKYADYLVKEDILKEERKANLRYFKANVNNPFFKHLKIAFNIKKLFSAGLVDFLKNSIPNISSIVLFGSAAKGQEDAKSDIDVLVIGKEKLLSLHDIEENIGRDINLHIRSWSHWNMDAKKNKPFYFEVISYGIPLYGELPVVRWK